MKNAMKVSMLVMAAALCAVSLGCSGTQGENSTQRFDCDYTILVRYQPNAAISTVTHQQCGFSLREDIEFEVFFRFSDPTTTPQPGSSFVLEKYIVTYSSSAGDVPGVHVPNPMEFSLGASEFIPTTSSSFTFSLDGAPLLQGFAKSQPPLASPAPGETRTFDATLTVFGHPVEDTDAECIGTFTQRFQVTNVAVPIGTDPCDLFGS